MLSFMGDFGGHGHGYQREAWEFLGPSCHFFSSFGTLWLAVVIRGWGGKDGGSNWGWGLPVSTRAPPISLPPGHRTQGQLLQRQPHPGTPRAQLKLWVHSILTCPE